MISQLQGTVVEKNLRSIVLDVNGVGYKIFVTPETLEIVSKQKVEVVRVHTYLAVRENALDLYGFMDRENLEFFELLITISGIGPKTAMGILSSATVTTIKTAIHSGDSSHLTKVGGIGKKIAEKIILELKEKIPDFSEDGTNNLQGETDALEALTSLGYSEHEARVTLRKLPKDISNASERVKQALKILGTK